MGKEKLHFYFINYIIFGSNNSQDSEGFYVGTFINATDAYNGIKKNLNERFPNENFIIRNFVKVE